MHPDSLYRFLRTLTSVGFFRETSDRCFALTRLSECLRADASGSMLATAQYVGADWTFAGWVSVMTTVRNGKTYHENEHGKPFFSWYDSDPDRRRIFDDAMTSMSTVATLTITAAYDFSSHQTIIDVGGGEGGLLAAILRKTPHLRGTLFDLPHVITRAEQVGLLSESEVAARVTMAGGDFFEEIPPGHDAYVLKLKRQNKTDAGVGSFAYTKKR
jgi:hypothetical protein